MNFSYIGEWRRIFHLGAHMAAKNPFLYFADDYFRYRPTYPQVWYRHLSDLCQGRELAVDCATGNGQAALGLAEHFSRVYAIDESRSQIANAFRLQNIEYHVSTAEQIELPDKCADIATVAQGVHWLDQEKFFAECRRILKKNGIVAVWCYNMTLIEPEIDQILKKLAYDILGPYWAPQVRKEVFTAYQNLHFPFKEVKGPEVYIQREWVLDNLLDYMRTWSAVGQYRMEKNSDPLTPVIEELEKAWGEGDAHRIVRWPLHYRIGKNLE